MNVIHNLVDSLERESLFEQNYFSKEKISDTTVFILAYFLERLREEQTVKLLLGEARDYITGAKNHCKHKHVMFSIEGNIQR